MITIEQLIQHAETLKEFDREAFWRDSIKNAYYAVYHKANRILDSNDISIMNTGFGKHSQLIARLKSVDNKLAKSIARDIESLRSKRVICCYELTHTITKLEATQHLTYCIGVIAKLERLNTILLS